MKIHLYTCEYKNDILIHACEDHVKISLFLNTYTQLYMYPDYQILHDLNSIFQNILTGNGVQCVIPVLSDPRLYKPSYQ